MHTARLLTVSCIPYPLNADPPLDADPPPLWTEWHTGVNRSTLPYPKLRLRTVIKELKNFTSGDSVPPVCTGTAFAVGKQTVSLTHWDGTFFKKKLWRTSVLFVGSLMPLFWTSGNVCPGFQSQGGSPGLCALLPACNGILRFTSGAIPADLWGGT